ncbi:hemagglutinin repeat-containing protein [Burkholderia vietnamiensis]|uniref:hemagglutinin repeat-containing protein n=1 Tax=Burkholderia vietnamiensis TaxID=60552 RepID=UPI00201275FF|nr:hemagglutinin repeat-containing protein [Burkholderia vietnamiensis]
MNKNQYRLVFSRVRGMLVAVEETAHATGKVTKGEASRAVGDRMASASASFALRHAAFAVLVAAGITPMWANAQVVGAGANAPSVIQTQNGLQQVNITKPSGAGVSLNTYSQFDVPKPGVIVNNSPTLTNTQQAGYINGNPNLGPNGSARIIVNQVNSPNPSQLRGFVEIAGQRAEMIISNPSGLVVDGGGFINTSRAILTTGTPNLNPDGSLAGFSVTRGLIAVQGAGLNATNVDQVDLISRAVQANAAIYATNLNVIAGANRVNHDTLEATRIQGDGAAPAVAIDVAQLGGMYSNRILLVGTEGGVGVRNAGTIAADAMGLTLTTDGRLIQSGKVSSTGNAAISAAGGVENSGTTYGQQSVSVNTGADVVNTGTLAAQHHVGVTAGALNSTGLLAAGVNSDGSVTQTGDLQLATTGQLNATGKNVAGGNVSAKGYGVNLAGSTTAANGDLSLTATAGDVNFTNATASAQGAITANAAGTVINDRGNLTSGGATSLTGNDVSNRNGAVSSQGPLSVTAADQIANQSGVFVSQSTMALRGSTVANNQGTVQSAGRATVDAITIDNTAGRITSLNSDGMVLTATGQLTNAAGTTAAGAQGGVIGGNGDVTVQGGTIANHATITSNTNLHVAGQSIDNGSGSLQAAQNVAVDAGAHLVNSGGTIMGQTAALNGATLDNSSGTVQARQVALTGTSLVNRGGTITQTGTGAMVVNVSGTLDNSSGGTLTNGGGQIGASMNATIHTGSMTNQGGAIVAPNLSITADSTLDNSGGQLTANQLALSTPNLTNHGGTITQYGSSAMGVNVSGALDNSAGGVIQTNSTDLTLAPAQLNNAGGTITHAGAGTLTIEPGSGAGAVNNAGGTVVTKGNAVVDASSWDNTSGIFAAQGDITATIAGDVNNAQGLVRAGTSLSLTNGGALVNHGGHIQAGQTVAGDTSTLRIQSASIDNADGSIADLGAGQMTVQGGSQITNSHVGGVSGMGAITGNGDVTVNAASISNTQGGQLSGASLHVQGTTLDNSGGQIGNVANSSGDVAVTTSGALTNTNGQISSTHDLTVTTPTLQGGGTYSAAHDASVNLQGDFSATPDYQFNVGHDLAFTLPGTFDNGGNVQSVNDLSVNAGNIVNSGALSAGGLLHTQSGNLSNTGAIVGGSVSLNATGTVSNVGPTALIGASDSNGTLEILAHDIENRDDTTATDSMPTTAIFGMGKVVLAGGKDASGNYTNAALVNNSSALIQSGGDMELHANKVTSTRRVMSTSGSTSNVDPAALAQYGISLSGCASYFAVNCAGGGQMIAGLRSDNITPAETAALIKQPGGMYIEPPHGGQWNSGYFYTTYTGTAVANTVTALSPTAQIVSGGGLNATSTGTLQNYWSSITAVGNLDLPQNYDGNGWTATGQQAPTVTVTYSGQYHYNNYDSSEYNWQLPFGNVPFVTSRPGGYTQVAPADVKTYSLPDYHSTLGSNGTISGTGVSINNTAANASIPSLGLLPGQAVPGLTIGGLSGSASGTKSGASAVHGGVINVSPVIASATAQNVLNNLTIPQGGLYRPNPAPNASYAIETNPAFTNQKRFISSDYFFSQIGVDLTHIPKRLGDGFYEQQLVRNQVTSLTGRAVLGPYTDLQAMYESLMAAGASLDKQLNLPIGASLSADQVSKLTSNVIMMETRVVDGQSVLVPVVYLAQAKQQNVNGPLITATDIDLRDAQNFTNSGTVKADNTLSIQGKQIDNAFGALQSGGLMSLMTTGNVDLTSAKVKAGSLYLNAGGDLILDSAVKSDTRVSRDGAASVTTTLGPIAQLDVKGDAGIMTGGNVEQHAGALTVGGNLGMLIGGNYDLGTQQVGEHKIVQRANGVSNTDINGVAGSAVNVGGVSMIGVNGDLTASGARINLGNGGTIAAKGNITLGAASATSTVDSNSSGSDHHGSYSETLHTSDQTVVGTTVHSGNTLSVASGKDISVIGSTISLDQGNVGLMAVGNVNVGAATETHVSNMNESHDHSGVASHASATNRVDQTTTYANGSAISADGVTVVSGKDINVTGSAIVGTHDVALTAKNNVNITAATDTYQDNEYHQEKHSGLSGSGGLGITIGSSEQSDRYNAASTTQSQSRSTVGSVEGNVTVSGGKDVHISGSDFVAGKAAGDVDGNTGNISITGQNVTIDPGQDVAQSHDQREAHSSGLTVAVTGTPYDTVRNLKANASSGNAFQRGQAVGNEIGASAADVPGISVSYGQSRSSSTTDMSSLTNSGSTVRGGGNVTVKATGGAQKDANGNIVDGDISVIGSAISAGGTATLDANRNVNLQASTDHLQQSTQSSGSSWGVQAASPSLGDLGRWVGGTANTGGNSPSPYNASRSNSDGSQTMTQQTAASVTGNSVVIKSKTGDINVVGSGISGTQGVDLVATQGAINVLAGLDTSTSHQESSSQQIGSLGSNGTATGFSVGVAKNHSVQDTASQTQSTMRSQIVSGNGNVTLDAKQDITVAGSDLSAGKDLTLIGKNLNLDPGTDATQSRMSQDSSQFGVSVALGGAVGNAVAQANQAFAHPARGGDSRLAALDKAQAGLAAYNAYQVGTALSKGPTNQALVKATVSIGGGTSHSEAQSSSIANDGSTLHAGGTATLIATGSGTKDTNGFATDGDINASGTRITAQNVQLNAARDINLTSAKDTSQQSSSNSSSSGSIGVGAAIGGQQNGFTLELGASTAHGHANGNSVTNRDTQITASDTLSVTSGRDTNLRGAEVSGNTVNASVGRDLNVQSQQDTSTYDSKQSSAGFQASICVPPFCYGQTVSGSASASQQNINANYQSVNQQSGIYAGTGGYNVNVGNHTQLDGGVIASTATSDKNSLSTQTLGYTNLENHATYSGDTVGFSASGGFGNSTPGGVNLNTPVKQGANNTTGALNSQGLGPSGFSTAGTSSDASGTTYAAVSPGKITVRGDAGAGHDSTAGLSRDTANANGAVQNTFNAQNVQNDIAVQQSVGQVGMQVVGDVADALQNHAKANARDAQQRLDQANAIHDDAAAQQAQADLTAANAQVAMWGPDGAARIASHAGVAGIGAAMGGGSVAGAIGGTIAGDAAGTVASQALGDTLGGTLLANAASGLAGAAAGGALGGSAGAISGAGGALSADLYNRQLHPQEKTKAQKIAADAKARGITNPDGSPITVDQIENAMRSASNSQYGETITTGMVVPLNGSTTTGQLYDTTGMKVTNDGAGNNYLVQDPSMLTSPSDTVRNLIQQDTGGANSPYSWNVPSPQAAQASSGAPRIDPYGPFSPGWNTGENSAGFQQPGIPAPDYVAVNGSGLGLAGSISLNLHNGQIYVGAGGSVPVAPGASVTFGFVPSNYGLPNAVQGDNTDQLLAGGSYSAAACAYGVCLGGNHAIGGATAVEVGLGLGAPTKGISLGGSAGTGVSLPVFKLPTPH